MLTITLLGPVISAILCFFFSRIIGSNILKLTLILYIISSLSSLYLLYVIITNNTILTLTLTKWSTILGINFNFTIDLISVSLLTVVIVIGTSVISYTNYYMATDSHLYRFVGLLSSFVSFMAILAISGNLVVLFIGWELIGLYSYLLIGFWSDRAEASNASLGAMLQNKFGDYLLSLGLILTFSQVSTLNGVNINTIYNYFNNTETNYLIGLIGISYFIASCAKSAQIGIHLWLILAMQGPTPVSSLLHAATLVVAGPILLFKVNSLVNSNLSLIVIIGITTALLGSILALIQSDIKGVIAYSTMSQFGYIISIAALSAQSIANLHITTHACFKACLFMAAGVVIHSTFDIQDNRRYGSLLKWLPLAYIATLICSFSLIAIPYTAGSISKDLILEIHASQYTFIHEIAFIIGSLVASITALYSIKLIIITYTNTANLSSNVYEKLHSANLYAFVPITVLTLLAVILGYFGQPFLIDAYGYVDSIVIAELYNLTIRPIPIVMVFLGILFALYWGSQKTMLNKIVYKSLVNRLYWPKMYTQSYINYLKLGSVASKLIDLGTLELFGPYGIEKKIIK
jgi:NADH-ubiquinone oxidoreductase chain 5